MVKLHLSPFQALVEETGGCSALVRGQGPLPKGHPCCPRSSPFRKEGHSRLHG